MHCMAYVQFVVYSGVAKTFSGRQMRAWLRKGFAEDIEELFADTAG